MANEVNSHNVEHLAIWARFVDADKNIIEDFLTFITLERTTGKYVAERIIEYINSVGLPLGYVVRVMMVLVACHQRMLDCWHE